MKKAFSYQTKIGTIFFVEEDGCLSYLFFDQLPIHCTTEETDLIKRASIQVQEYLNGERTEFELPLKTKGTDFQKQVWKGLQAIPYGTTLSYIELAEKIGHPKAMRAVGNANHHNPIPIIIPCHRVIRHNGGLGGYGGGLDRKSLLLSLEQKK